jgi:hypothetical protein
VFCVVGICTGACHDTSIEKNHEGKHYIERSVRECAHVVMLEDDVLRVVVIVRTGGGEEWCGTPPSLLPPW